MISMKTLRVDYSNLLIANLVTKGLYTTIFLKKNPRYLL